MANRLREDPGVSPDRNEKVINRALSTLNCWCVHMDTSCPIGRDGTHSA